MKKIVFAIFFICFGIQTFMVSGQSHFTISFEGGASYAYVHGNKLNPDYFKPIPGGFSGLALQYFLLNHLAFKTGLAYERKGMELFINLPNGIDYTFHFDYITIPILITASIGKKVRFIASAGPYVSYLIKKTYINNDYAATSSEPPVPDDATYKKKNNLDFGIMESIGIEVRIKNQFSVSLEIRDHYGLVDTRLFPIYVDIGGTQYTTDRRSINNSAIISLGFSYYFRSSKGK